MRYLDSSCDRQMIYHGGVLCVCGLHDEDVGLRFGGVLCGGVLDGGGGLSFYDGLSFCGVQVTCGGESWTYVDESWSFYGLATYVEPLSCVLMLFFEPYFSLLFFGTIYGYV